MTAIFRCPCLILLCCLGPGCTFSPDLSGSSEVPCLEDGSCQAADCVCLGGAVCVPEDRALPWEHCRICSADGDCDDGLDCTADTCDSETGRCIFTPGQEGLDAAGSCENGRDDDCDGNIDGADLDCACVDCVCEVDADCADANFCTLGFCESQRCRYDFVPAGTGCPGLDDDRCTSTCDGVGSCLNDAPLDCDDGQACTEDHCDHVQGSCDHQPRPDGASCPGGDDDWCNSSCLDGLCQDGPPALAGEPCLDGGGCTTPDTCDGQGLCKAGPFDDGLCPDGQFCLPACTSAAAGCLPLPPDPSLHCLVGPGEVGARVATCRLDLGLAGQAECVQCSSPDGENETVWAVQENQPGQYSFLVHENAGSAGQAAQMTVTCVWAAQRPDLSASVTELISFREQTFSDDFGSGIGSYLFLDGSTWGIDQGALSQQETCSPVNLAVLDEPSLAYPSITLDLRVEEMCSVSSDAHTIGLLAHAQYSDPLTCDSTSAYVCGLDFDNDLLIGGRVDQACAGNSVDTTPVPPLVPNVWYEIGMQVGPGVITCYFAPSDPDQGLAMSWFDDTQEPLGAGGVGLGVSRMAASFDNLYIDFSNGR